MITRITGVVNRVLDEDARLQVGPIEYGVLIPECVRRQLQVRTGQEVTLHTVEYIEGNQSSNRWTPRLIGFLHESELEFFDLFCTVEKIGVRKALKALARPVKEIADAIQRQDAKWLTTLPGVGTTTAEQIVTTLKRKVTKFALAPTPAEGDEGGAAVAVVVDGNVIEDAYNALLSVGHGPAEARQKLDAVIAGGRPFKTVEDVLLLIYSKQA
jgi:holliday junction DNA helicase RuvA